jgi:serine protease Do
MRKGIIFIAFLVLTALPAWSVDAQSRVTTDSWMGVYTQTVDNDLKEAFKLESDHGVVINMIIPDSPADKSGLKRGDILLSFDGTQLTGSDQLVDLVGGHSPGDKVNIEYLRDGNRSETTITLGSRKDDNTPMSLGNTGSIPRVYSKSYTYNHSSMSDTYIGVNLESLNSQLGEYFGVKDGQGVLVTEVIEDSPAQKAGLKAGDVIIEIDGHSVAKPSDIREIVVETKSGDKLNLAILRNKDKMEMAVEVAETPDNLSTLIPGLNPPDFDDFNLLFSPKMKGLMPGTFDNSTPDMESMQETLKELQEQMKELQKKMETMTPAPGQK